jgi:hypothetical protein
MNPVEQIGTKVLSETDSALAREQGLGVCARGPPFATLSRKCHGKSRQITVNCEQKVNKEEKLAHHVSSQLAESPRKNVIK